MSKLDLKKMYKDQPEKLKALESKNDDVYVIFDTNQGNHKKTKTKVLIKELYFKPCLQYPNGYFYIFTDAALLEHGELPYGIFPIKWVGTTGAPVRAVGIIDD